MRAHAMAKPQSKHRGSNPVSWALVVVLCTGILLTYLGSSSQLLGRLGLSATARMHTPTALNGYKPETMSQYRELANQLDPELMAELPVEFNSTFRTPCWHRSNGLGCLPFFYVLGGFQSGAYSLYSTLTGHPDIAQDHNARPHFWAELDKKVVDYVDNFAPSQQFLWEAPSRNILGEASESSFAFYWSANVRSHRSFLREVQYCQGNCSLPGQPSDAADQCKEQCYPRARAADEQLSKAAGTQWLNLDLPLLMRAAYGSQPAKLIIMLRDPVERLHNAFYEYNHYNARYGATAEGFATFVEEQLGAYERCLAMGHSERECILAFEALGTEQEKVFFHCDQVLRGMYWLYLEGWMTHFPDTHVRVVYYEEYQLDRRRVVDSLTDFLEVLPVLEDDVWAQLDAAHQPEADAAAQQRMLPATRARLQRFYEPHNLRLGRLMGLGAVSPWEQQPWLHRTSAQTQTRR